MKTDILKLLIVLGHGYKKRIFLIFTGVLLLAFFEVFSIAIVLPFMKLVLDLHSGSSESFYLETIKSFLPINDNQIIILFSLVVVGSFVFKNLFYFLIYKFQMQELHKIRANISKKMFNLYIHMDYEIFIKKNVTTMIHNSTGQVNLFVLVYLQSLLFLFSELIVILSLFLLLFFINAKVMLVLALLVSLIGYLMVKVFKNTLKEASSRQNNATIKMYKTVNEGISALKEIKVLQVESFFVDLFDNYSNKYQEVAVLANVIQVIPKLILEIIFMAGLVGIIMVSVLMGLNLEKLIPTLIVFSIAFFKILPSANRVINYNNLINSSRVSLDILFDEMLEKPHINAIAKKAEVHRPEFKTAVYFNSVTFSYDQIRFVFKDFTIDIPKKSTVAFIGRSGAGKTTLIDMILGLIKPQSGSVMFDGFDINLNLEFWHNKVGYIPQSISFIDDTIRNNIALGVANIDESRLYQSIADAQLEDFVKSLPDKLDTKIGDKGVRLSGGQRQRIGIARALYKNPEVLIFDEATSALDIETERAVTESIKALSGSKTIVIVAHRISTIKDCDIIYVLENGEVVGRGSYDELLVGNKWFQEINN